MSIIHHQVDALCMGALIIVLLNDGLLMIFVFLYNWMILHTSILKFVWWSFLSRFLLLAISITISPCSLLLLHFCAMVYCTLIYQACQVTSFFSFQVLMQVTFFYLLLLVTLLHWRLTDMQYIALLCAPMSQVFSEEEWRAAINMKKM